MKKKNTRDNDDDLYQPTSVNNIIFYSNRARSKWYTNNGIVNVFNSSNQYEQQKSSRSNGIHDASLTPFRQ